MQKLFIFLLVLFIISCDDEQTNRTITVPSSQSFNALEYIDLNSDLSLFREAILLINSENVFLDSLNKKTFFIPNNTAINSYLNSKNYNDLSELSENELEELVLYPIINSNLNKSSIIPGNYKSILESNYQRQYDLFLDLNFSGFDTTIVLNNKSVLFADQELLNGSMNVINSVIIPPTIYEYLRLNTELFRYRSAVENASSSGELIDLLNGENPITLIATQNNPLLSHLGDFDFSKMSSRVDSIVKYNILEQQKLILDLDLENNTYLNQILEVENSDGQLNMNLYKGDSIAYRSRFLYGNIQTKNGLIHVADTVVEYYN